MRGWIMSLLGGLALPAALQAGTIIGSFQVGDEGSIKTADASIAVIHFGANWSSSTIQSQGNINPDQGYPIADKEGFSLKGAFAVKDGVFHIDERIAKSGPDEIELSVSLKSDAPIPTNELALLLRLPVEKFAGRKITVDGGNSTFPAEYEENSASILSKPSFNSLSLQCQDFKLCGSAGDGIIIQDDRKYKQPFYSIRIRLPLPSGEVASSSIKLKLSAVPYDTKPLSMKGAMNFGFADEVAGDGKGGWTDQGPENDLRMMKPGLAKLGGVSFDIVDPASNGGKSCLVFGGEQIAKLPKSAGFDVPNVTMKYLCVLHALAWPPSGKERIGAVDVRYADGSSKSFPIVNGVDAANWWNPMSVDNAELVWTGENKSAYVGLFMSTLALDPKPVSRVDFESDGNSMWMTVAASASNDDIPRLKTVPTYIVESENWKPFDYPRDMEPGSALDFSKLLDAPAGKYGRVIVSKGKFAFEKTPDKAERFFGTNICMGANFLDKPHCELLAKRLAAIGYNSVRFHHFDNQVVKKGPASSTELNPVEIDKLDYLFKSLKDRGIYITIDVYISRIPAKGEFPEFGDRALTINDLAEIKSLMLVSDAAMDNFETYARNLLTHVNPYTGLAWKDDPALAFISLINEDTIFSCWNRNPAIKAIYEAKFEQWLKAKAITPASEGDKVRLMDAFLIEIYNKAYARMAAFMGSLGVKAPLTDQNMWSNVPMTLMRDKYDYVDNHFYWDHPGFPVTPWKMPMSFGSKSAVVSMAACPAGSFPSRIFGKPFTITEFNYCFPNPYRAEGGALTGAYAALQDWDAIYRFTYTHSAKSLDEDAPGGLFDGAVEPMQFLSEKLALLLFLRGDVKPSEVKIPVIVDAKSLESENAQGRYSHNQICAGLVDQLGSIVDYDGNPALPAGNKLSFKADAKDGDVDVAESLRKAGVMGKGDLDIERKFARSSTGELELDATAGTFKVVSPKSEALLFLSEGSLSGSALSAENKGDFTSISASALDGKPLAQSSRMLVMHLTDAMNAKTKFSDKRMILMESAGTLPHLARRGIAGLTLKLAPGATPMVYGIDLAGKRIGEVESAFSKDGILSFTADTFAFKTPCFAYEIVR